MNGNHWLFSLLLLASAPAVGATHSIAIGDECDSLSPGGCVAPLQISAGHTGSWYNPAQNGHGFALQVIAGQPMQLLASWLTFAPQGGQSWVVGLGPIDGDRAVLRGFQSVGPGGRFPPGLDAAKLQQEEWGTLTFTFSDCNHGRVDWNSTAPGFASGGMDSARLTLPAGLTCRDDDSGMGYWDY